MANVKRHDHQHRNDSLYPRSVYECPNGHGQFRSYAYGGAVCWCCPTCGEAGHYVGYSCAICTALVCQRCADCGLEGEMTGHMTCQYPGASESAR